jgi:hypothetical protein
MLIKTFAATAFMAVILSSSAHSQADGTAGGSAASASALYAKAARSGGKVRVIVEFGAPVVGDVAGEPGALSRNYAFALKANSRT